MTLLILREEFSICKLTGAEGVELTVPFTFLSVTDDEISLVCPTAVVPANTVNAHDGWRALKIDGNLDFNMVGVVSRLSALLAESGISVFIVSTYNTDYILVQGQSYQAAIAVLTAGGHRILQQ